MFILVNFFFNLCLMKTTPDKTPASEAFLVVLMAITITLQYWALANNVNIIATPLLTFSWSAFLTIFLAFGTWLLLRMNNKAQRFIKTLVAILACSLLLTIPRLLLSYAYAPQAEASLTSIALIINMASVGLQIYELIVFGFILQHALGTTLARGCLLTILITLFTLFSTATLLPWPEFANLPIPEPT